MWFSRTMLRGRLIYPAILEQEKALKAELDRVIPVQLTTTSSQNLAQQPLKIEETKLIAPPKKKP